jgi:hypothetical protein
MEFYLDMQKTPTKNEEKISAFLSRKLKVGGIA